MTVKQLISRFENGQSRLGRSAHDSSPSTISSKPSKARDKEDQLLDQCLLGSPLSWGSDIPTVQSADAEEIQAKKELQMRRMMCESSISESTSYYSPRSKPDPEAPENKASKKTDDEESEEEKRQANLHKLYSTPVSAEAWYHGFNPSLPGEEGRQQSMARTTQAATLRALDRTEGPLDTVFDTVEKYTCRGQDADIDQFSQSKEAKESSVLPRTVDRKPDPEESISDPWSRRYDKKDPIFNSENSIVERDLLDSMFEGVEQYTCAPEDDTKSVYVPRKLMIPQQTDMLDRVFEGVEQYTCSPREDPLKLKVTQKSIEKVPTSFSERELDFVTQPTKDILDQVFEPIEKFTCRRGDTTVETSSRGSDPSPPPQTKSSRFGASTPLVISKLKKVSAEKTLENTHSPSFGDTTPIVPRRVSEIEKRSDPPPVEAPPRPLKTNARAPLKPSKQVTKDADMLDFLFDGMERTVCNTTSTVPKNLDPKPDLLDRVFEGTEKGICDRSIQGTGAPEKPIDLTTFEGESRPPRLVNLFASAASSNKFLNGELQHRVYSADPSGSYSVVKAE